MTAAREGFDFAAIKASVNIVSVIGQHVKLARKGNLHEGCCPFHNERTPSFKVYPDGNWHCFGCNKNGDVIDFVAEYHGVSIQDAIAQLGGADTYATPSSRAESERAATEREIERQAARAAAIMLARKRWDTAEPATPANAYLARKRVKPHMARTEFGSLLVPVYDAAGDIQSVQTIGGDGSKLFQPDAPMKGGRLNFGIAVGRSLICEGFATGASIFESLPDRVCVGFSSNGVKHMAREFAGAAIDFAIAADRNAASDMLALGRELACPVYFPPAPYDDFNDMAVALGHEAVAELLRGPLSLAIVPDTADDMPDSDDDSMAPPSSAPTPVNDNPVDLWARNVPPPMPVGLLPPLLERFAVTRAQMLGGDPGGLAMAALAVCAAAIPDTISVKVKQHENWTENARLWVMLIGDPSSKKSPIMRAAAGGLSKMDSAMLREHEQKLLQWQRDKKDGCEGDKPQETRLRIEDITMEAAQEVCRWSPAGVLALQDELSGWFGGIEKYAGGKGSAKDRSFWLRAYNGGEYAVNRISRSSFLIDNLSISILGGIQPDALRKIMADATEDGLIQRFLPVVLPPATIGVDEELPDVVQEYDALIAGLRALVPPSAMVGGAMPITLDKDARAIRSKLEVEHHSMVLAMERISRKFAAHIGKYDGMFARLCLVWHCIENINAAVLPDTITGATARKVADYLHGYIMGQARAFYHGVIGVSEDQDVIQDVAGYILAHGVEVVTMRTFQRGSTLMRKLTRANIEPVCQQLEALGWVDKIDARGERLACNVNPRVHEVYAEKASAERERRKDVQATIRKITGDGE